MTGLEFRALRDSKMANNKDASMNAFIGEIIVKIFKNFIKNRDL